MKYVIETNEDWYVKEELPAVVKYDVYCGGEYEFTQSEIYSIKITKDINDAFGKVLEFSA